VLLLDRNNYHTFLPLLYQVGAAEVAPSDIIYPVRSILRRKKNVRFLMENHQIDRKKVGGARQIRNTLHYLVLALERVAFLRRGGAAARLQLKTLDHAIALRNHILLCFEGACQTDISAAGLLTFTIVGGGPLAWITGAWLSWYAILCNDYPLANARCGYSWRLPICYPAA
jgi:NADH dehydrogenase